MPVHKVCTVSRWHSDVNAIFWYISFVQVHTDCNGKNYTFLLAILQKKKKKIKILKSQFFLHWKGYFIGYQRHYKWFDLKARIKSYMYVHFSKNRWKQLGPFSQSLLITAFCLYVITEDCDWQWCQRDKKHSSSPFHVFDALYGKR